MNEVTCACAKCRAMCAGSACLPTPQEAIALIEHGHAKRLTRYEFGGRGFVGPALVGKPQAVRTQTRGAACTFYRDGNCELHAAGLKPYEGRIAHHDRDWLPVRADVMRHWRRADYAYVVGRMQNEGAL